MSVTPGTPVSFAHDVNVAVEYHQSGTDPATKPEFAMEAAVAEEEILTPVAMEGAANDSTSPMDITDEMCATTVAPEPSALEASVVAEGVAPESFIVHELSDDDEEDDDVQITSVETIPVSFELSEDNDDPFIKMANDWYCCKVCSRLYQAFPQLVEHLRDVHPDKADILRQKSKESYFRAKEGDLQTKQYASGTYVKCDLCDTMWTSKGPVTRHRWRYHGAYDDCRRIYCREPSCECFFMEMKALNRHLEIVHGRLRKPRKKPEAPAQHETDDVTPVRNENDHVLRAHNETGDAPPAQNGNDDEPLAHKENDEDVVLVWEESSQESLPPLDEVIPVDD